MRIAVVFGGISPERNVSIAGGMAVVKALKSLGHDVLAVDPAFGGDALRNGEELANMAQIPDDSELKQFPERNIIECFNSNIFDNVDAAFLVLHGLNGEDGKVQSLLELRGIPYTGSKILASALSIDKAQSKAIFLANNILTPAWRVVTPNEYNDYEVFEQLRKDLGQNLVIKPNDQGSTIGISMIFNGNLDDIADAVVNAGKYSRKVLVESFIPGREVTVGIIGGQALPLIEIKPEGGFYDYEHKYSKGKTEYICPMDVSEDISDFTQDIAVAAFEALGCEGFARADFRLSEDGQPFCLEMNTIPGFTDTSLVPKAAKSLGIEFPELCQNILQLALGD